MDANYTITEFYTENDNLKVCGLTGYRNRTSHNYSERISSCQNCLKISQRRTFSFCKTKKCGNYGYNCIIKGSLTKNQMMNFVRILLVTKCKLHTSTRSELNLIKSVIYIYIYTLFYILYFTQYLYKIYNK